MRKNTVLVGAALALGVSGAAWAQDAGMDPMTMTCADVAEMDESNAEGAIYFLAGHEAAMGSAMGSGVTGVTGTAAGTDSTATGTTGTTGTATTGTGTESAAMGGSMRFEDIDVAAIMSACEDAPESLLSTVIRDSASN